MGSTLRRLKMYYINNFRVTRHGLWWIAGVSLVLMLASRLFDYRPSAFYETSGKEDRDAATISRVLESMVDTRPMRCRDHAYEFTRLEVIDVKVTIATQLSGADDLDDLMLTLTSIVLHTPYDLYDEIIVIDDGTDSVQVQQEFGTFLQDSRFNKVKVYRSSTQDGHSSSRFKASAVAKGNVLIFVDTTAVVNHGWIQPLIAKLLDEPNLVAVPHYDDWTLSDRLVRMDDERPSVFTWNLATVYSGVADEADMIRTPVMRGDVFAVHKNFLDRIGGFDEHLRQARGSGYHMELSFRVWTCGGAIQMVTCSRVAVRGAQQALRIGDDVDFRHIVELTFSDQLKHLIYQQAGVDKTMSGRESDSLMLRRNYLRHQHAELNCHPVSWYLSNVAMSDVVVPSADADHFGKLRSATSGLCLGADTEVGIEMLACHEHLYERQLVVEKTTRGAVVRDGSCLELTGSGSGASVRFAPCEADSPRQHWWMADGRLTAVAAPRKCLTDSPGHHIATLEDCATVDGKDSTATQRWSFINL